MAKYGGEYYEYMQWVIGKIEGYTGHLYDIGNLHAETVEKLYRAIEKKDPRVEYEKEKGPEELRLGEEVIEVPLGRPVPQTYGDWNDLGTDIKEKAGIDDFKTLADVNEHLYHIWRKDVDPATAQVSQRWLANKARQMGID